MNAKMLQNCIQVCQECIDDCTRCAVPSKQQGPQQTCTRSVSQCQFALNSWHAVITAAQDHIHQCKNSDCIAACKKVMAACQECIHICKQVVQACTNTSQSPACVMACKHIVETCYGCIETCHDMLKKACFKENV